MSFARSSVETVLVHISLVSTGLVAGIINARWLGVEGVGIFVLLLLIRDFAFRLGNLGFGSAFAFFVARSPAQARTLLPLALWTGLAASLASGTVVLAVWRLPFSPWNDIEPGLVHLCLLLVPLSFLRIYLQRILSGELRIREMNVSDLIASIGYVALLVGFVIVLNIGLIGAILSVLLSETFALLFLLWRSVHHASPRVGADAMTHGSRPTIGELWRYGRWSYLLTFSSFLIEALPLFLLKTFSASNMPVGLLSRAQNLARQQRVMVLPVAQVLFPFTATSQESKATQRTNVLCRNSLVLVALFVGLMALFIRPILLLLYGEAFLPAAEIFYALAPGAVLWPVGHFLAIHIAASGHPKPAFLAGFTTAAAAAVLCASIIPRYGAVGAGLSASAIYALRTFLLLLVYARLSSVSWLDVMVPRRSDWTYYRRLVDLITSGMLRKTRAG